MVRVFLDTNYFIDLVNQRNDVKLSNLGTNAPFISPLSAHITMYVNKRKVPCPELAKILEMFSFVPFDTAITNKALIGPTSDIEDNVQLHSASTAVCDYFLTRDKKLLAMKFFGKTRIVSKIEAE